MELIEFVRRLVRVFRRQSSGCYKSDAQRPVPPRRVWRPLLPEQEEHLREVRGRRGKRLRLKVARG